MTQPAPILDYSTPPLVQDHRAAVLAGFLGWTLDAFDFFILTLTLPAIAATFHRKDSDISLAITLTLAFRPVGAFIFGLLADRYGRRRPLMINLIFYSSISMLSGLAPSYWTFLVLRSLFGIGMGGEWGVGASLAMEKVPARLRGILSGLLQEGYAAGNILAAIAYFIVFPRFGWRPLFLIGGAPALLAFFVRYRVGESEVWKKTKHGNWTDLGKGIARHYPTFFAIFILMTMMNLASHGTQDMYPTFLQRERGFSPQAKSVIVAISMVGAIAGGLTFGFFSDRIGRRRAMGIAFLCGIIVVPLWAHAPTTILLIVGAFVLQFFVQGAWGIIPAHINELSPDNVRGFLPGFAYQCGVCAASSFGYLQSLLATRTTWANTMALSATTVFAMAALVISFGRERHGITFGEDGPPHA